MFTFDLKKLNFNNFINLFITNITNLKSIKIKKKRVKNYGCNNYKKTRGRSF
jgi:hypothetical protein